MEFRDTMDNVNPGSGLEPPIDTAASTAGVFRWPLVALVTTLSVLVVVVVYVWFVSFGTWTKWPNLGYASYYDQLAMAFGHGQLALRIKPAPALLALANPYDASARAGFRYPLDISLYQGKYYLYFGPAPALLLALIKPLVPAPIGDQYLVFAFVCGIAIFQSLLIAEIWRRFYAEIPAWLVALCILFSGLSVPLTRLVTQGRVYEAAITGGQFFFLAGYYCILTALDKGSISSGRLLMGGLAWAFAVASRLTQAVPVGFMVLMVVVFVVAADRQSVPIFRRIYPLAALGLPLALGTIILGWYNWARFHSVFETGWSYQLNEGNLQFYRAVLFSPRYILPNLFNYLLMPPGILGTFSFIKPALPTGASIFSFIPLPKVYFTEPLTGLFFGAPFILFAPVAVFAALPRNRKAISQTYQGKDLYAFRWLITSLAGCFLLGFILIVSYYYVAVRFVADFMPALTLLSIIGFWQGYRLLLRRPPVSRKLYLAGGLGLMAASAVISSLLVFSDRMVKFQMYNPDLWRQLAGLFAR